MKLRDLAAGAALALSFAAGSALATTTFYTSSADFLAAVPPAAMAPTEGYESHPLGTLVPNGGQLGDLTYQFSSADIGRVGDLFPHFDSQSLEATSGQFSAGDSISVTPPWHLHWFGVFVAAGPLTTDSIFLNAFGETRYSGSQGYDTGAFYFIGATTDAHAFHTVTFGMTDGGLPFSVDNLMYNSDPIPEPGVWAMMLVGFGGLGAAMRRARHRRAAAPA
jgi:hypothetical protein